MNINQLVLGIYETNCYLIEKDNHVLIIDPGKKAERIINAIGEKIVDGIILTHGHFDHIGAVDDLINYYGTKFYIDRADEVLLNSPYNTMATYSGRVSYQADYLKEGHNKIGVFEFEVMRTPGHTEGSVLILIDNHLFTGDTLFKDSVGRTDLYLGNNSKLIQSLKFIKTLNPDYIIYPGHGEISTLEKEFKYNPFLK